MNLQDTRGGKGDGAVDAPGNLLDHKRDAYWVTDDNITTPDVVLDLHKGETQQIYQR